METFELQIDRQKLVFVCTHVGVLVEVLSPTNYKDGHGWGLTAQLHLDLSQVQELTRFLTATEQRVIMA